MKARAALIALLLAGCTTVGPNHHQPDIAVPAQFSEPHDAQAVNKVKDTSLATPYPAFTLSAPRS